MPRTYIYNIVHMPVRGRAVQGDLAPSGHVPLYLNVVTLIPTRPPVPSPGGYCYVHTATLCSLQQYTHGELTPYPTTQPVYCFVLCLVTFCDWQTRRQFVQ